MAGIAAVIFDVGQVLYHWNPRVLFERLIPDDQALDAFLRDVVPTEWHFQHDAGRPFAETCAERIALFPEHAAHIPVWGERFNDSVGPVVEGMAQIVADLAAHDVPLYAITNYSAEFWPAFHAREAAMFAPFRDIVVSGEEGLIKPDTAIYTLALARFGLRAEQAIFIDDRADNIVGAQQVGMHGHLFRDAPTLRAELAALELLPAIPAL